MDQEKEGRRLVRKFWFNMLSIGLVGLTTGVVGAKVEIEISSNLRHFEYGVDGLAKKHNERREREEKFYEKTGLDVNQMSLLDRYTYGRALDKEYLDYSYYNN